jgi:hypothetical protein
MPDEASQRRAQRRIEVAVPIQVRGVDSQGREFEETTEALEVSRRGLSFSTQRELPVYSTLTVVIPDRGPVRPGEGPTDFFTTAAVVRVVKEGETSRVSVRFVGATLRIYTSEND